MKMSEYKIFLIGGEDDESGTLMATNSDKTCHLEFKYRRLVLKAATSDIFEGFCQIRLELEKEKLIPSCYGASLNVYPSGMGRDMGTGLKAYKMTMGSQARLEDLVHILSAGADVIPAYVSLQREFFESWLKSLRS